MSKHESTTKEKEHAPKEKPASEPYPPESEPYREEALHPKEPPTVEEVEEQEKPSKR